MRADVWTDDHAGFVRVMLTVLGAVIYALLWLAPDAAAGIGMWLAAFGRSEPPSPPPQPPA